MKELLLTAPQREALDRLVNAGGVAFVNQKRNGFDQFRACDALALLIARLAEVEQGELRLSALGRLLTAKSALPPNVRDAALDWFVNQGPEYP